MKRAINFVIWTVYLLAMSASLTHVAFTFNTLELPGIYQVNGWIAAISIDAGLAAFAYSIQLRKRARRGAIDLWFGIIMFSGISGYANILHALSVSPSAVVEAFVFSGSLPVLVILLGGIASSNDSEIADAIERGQRRKEREEEKSVQVAAIQEIAVVEFACDRCERTFGNRYALSAHAKSHKNGHKEVAVVLPVERREA